MPKIAKPLSALAVRNLMAPGMHPVGTVSGLYLQIAPTGARSWILRLTVGDKRREMGLGGYPTVTLQQAHELARAQRGQVRAGVDPVQAKRDARSKLLANQARAKTFRHCAEAHIASQEAGWKNAKHGQQWTNTLATYAYPVFGDLVMADIDTSLVLEVLRPIWTTKTETATRVRSRIESVIDYAKTLGYCDGPNPARWKGHLDKLLASPKKVRKVKHHPSLPYQHVSAFMAALRGCGGIAARALEYTVLTAVRSDTTRGALWSEIDLDAGTWVVPAERMKAEREHRVPLSAAAIDLLKALPRFEGRDEVFLSPTMGMLSDMALAQVIRRMNDPEKRWIDPTSDREAVPHGFRTTFRTWAGECTDYSWDVAEAALGHKLGNDTELAYFRSDLFEKRAPLMTDWAKFLGQRPTDAARVATPSRARARR
ncbi:MAG: integrase arm-type DNA-binding domain-containing protein [Rubrivivax sp.]